MFDTSLIANATYYSTEDIVTNIKHVWELLLNAATQPGMVGKNITYAPKEVIIRHITGPSKVEVFTEHIYSMDGSHVWAGRMVIGIKRKNQLFDSDMERIASLAGDEQVLPPEHVLGIIAGIIKLVMSRDAGRKFLSLVDKQGIAFVSFGENLAPGECILKVPVRISRCAEGNGKKEAQIMTLRSKLKRTIDRLGYGTRRIQRLEEELRMMHEKEEFLKRNITKMSTKLSTLEEE